MRITWNPFFICGIWDISAIIMLRQHNIFWTGSKHQILEVPGNFPCDSQETVVPQVCLWVSISSITRKLCQDWLNRSCCVPASHLLWSHGSEFGKQRLKFLDSCVPEQVIGSGTQGEWYKWKKKGIPEYRKANKLKGRPNFKFLA